jgi:hypothetical protein
MDREGLANHSHSMKRGIGAVSRPVGKFGTGERKREKGSPSWGPEGCVW